VGIVPSDSASENAYQDRVSIKELLKFCSSMVDKIKCINTPDNHLKSLKFQRQGIRTHFHVVGLNNFRNCGLHFLMRKYITHVRETLL